MPPTKRLLRILAVIAILALTAIAVLWLGARTTFARRAAAGWIENTTGLPATVGSLRLGFLPRPSIDVGGIALAQPPGFDAGPLLEAGEIRVTLSWGSLFGAPAIGLLSIEDAVARPVIAADGRDNWSGLIGRLAELGGEGASGWSIGQFAFERGALEFQDLSNGSSWRLTAVTIAAEDIAPAVEFPVEIRLAGVAEPYTFHFALTGRAVVDPDAGVYSAMGLTFRGWAGGEPLPLAGVEMLGTAERIGYDGAAGYVVIPRGTFNVAGIPGEFMARYQPDRPDAQLAFTIKTESFAPRAPAIAFGMPLPATADPQAFGMLQVSFEGRMANGVLRLEPLAARLDDTQVEGHIVPAQRLVRAEIDRIDVDRYLAPEGQGAKAKKATLEALVAELGEFDIDAEIRIAEARLAGAKLRDIVIRVELESGQAP